MKISLILLNRWRKQFEALTDEQAGKLLKAAYAFQQDKKPPDFSKENKEMLIFWLDIKAVLENQIVQFEERLKRQEAGGELENREK